MTSVRLAEPYIFFNNVTYFYGSRIKTILNKTDIGMLKLSTTGKLQKKVNYSKMGDINQKIWTMMNIPIEIWLSRKRHVPFKDVTVSPT